MKILFYDMGSYLYQDSLESLRGMGHEVHTVYYHFEDRCNDSFFCTRFREKLKERPYDLIFSINFFPLVAQLANEFSLPYLSWSCDSPLAEELEPYFSYETNYIFLFDRLEVKYYRSRGYSRVFHMPLAVNAERLSALQFPDSYRSHFRADLSFVGSLYPSSLDGIFLPLDDYCKGYLQGAIDAQLLLYGCDLITPMLTDELIQRVNDCYRRLAEVAAKASSENPAASEPTFFGIDRRGLAFALQKQITYAERVGLLTMFGDLCDTRFYSTETYDFPSPVRAMGPVKYHTQMPAVFRYSRLNLCPTLRSIISGIPLRSLDIMACGGALLSNDQPELAEHFTDGEEVILYHTLEEAMEKATYYLEHEDERARIAAKGLKKVRCDFRYEDKLRNMLSMVTPTF